MAIVFNCPHCGELHRVKDEFAGKLAKCKRASCKKQVLIPLASTVAVNGPPSAGSLDAESLAAAALAEEVAPPPPQAETPAAKKILINCLACDHLFEVEQAMQGKNARCPECGHVFRVAKVIEEKPADWRDAHKKKPSLAKVDEPAPSGAWDTTRKGVSGGAIRQAGAGEFEEEEEPRERRIRRVKQTLYGLAFIGVIVFAVVFLRQSRREGAREELMAKAVVEAKDGQKNEEFLAAIECYAAEYQLRDAAKKRDNLDIAKKKFEDARGKLQALAPPQRVDRNAMLIELALCQVQCGGDFDEVNKDLRLPWEKVHPEIRKTLGAIPSSDYELRLRAMRLVTRKLAAKDQGLLALTLAKNFSNDAEYPEMAGRAGIELFLAGKKDLAEQVLAKFTQTPPKTASPGLTALWLALNPTADEPPGDFPHVRRIGKGLSPQARLAYAEGRALQGRVAEAMQFAGDLIEAEVRVAAVGCEVGKSAEAGPLLDSLVAQLQSAVKASPKTPLPAWQLCRIAELAAQKGKVDTAEKAVDLLKGNPVEPWARLEIFRAKLALHPKERADEIWIDSIDPARLPAALARAEAARHNLAMGDHHYRKSTVEGLPKGTIRPFGYAGIALGEQDSKLK